MRQETINIYQFSELPEEAKAKAIKNLYDINVGYNWWDVIYEDAETVGIKIINFDIDRDSYCEGEFFETLVEIAKAIIEEHGEHCETYNTAKAFLDDGDAEEFEKDILEDYRIILQKEFEYRTSEEAIIEANGANEYEVTENGDLNELAEHSVRKLRACGQ